LPETLLETRIKETRKTKIDVLFCGGVQTLTYGG
jgi:hypothetical protein